MARMGGTPGVPVKIHEVVKQAKHIFRSIPKLAKQVGLSKRERLRQQKIRKLAKPRKSYHAKWQYQAWRKERERVLKLNE